MEMTVGNCLLDPASIIQVVTIFTETEECQTYCYDVAMCNFFRFNGETCYLLTKEYRKECKVEGGPVVSSLYILGPITTISS